MEQDQLYLEDIIKGIVQYPEAVKTTRTTDEMGVLIELSADPSDMGKIIGKGGATANAIRIILRAFGSKQKSRVNLKILEPERSSHRGGYNNNY